MDSMFLEVDLKRFKKGNRMMNGLVFALFVFAVLSSYSKSVEYLGPADGAFAQASNWRGGQAPAKGDAVLVPDGRHVVVGPADLSVLTNLSEIVLQGKSSVLEVRDADVEFMSGAAHLSGVGEFRASATGARQPRVCLRQDNSSFAGSFVFTNVHPVVCGPKALGRKCPVTFFKTRADGIDSFHFAADGEYASDITVVPPRGQMWYAFAAFGANARVVNCGKVRVGPMPRGNCLRFQAPPNVTFVQAGAIETSSRVDMNGDVRLECEFRFTGTGEALFNDAGDGRVRIGPGFSFNGAKGAQANIEALLRPGVLGAHKELVVDYEGGADVQAGTYLAEDLLLFLKGSGREALQTAETGPHGEVVLRFTPETPVREIRDRVRTVLAVAGGRPVVVSLAEGTYPIESTVELGQWDSGRPGRPVVWRGEGAGAWFSAGIRLAGWREDPREKGVWRVSAPRDAQGMSLWADCLFVDGVRREVAAYPADGAFIHATNITERILAKAGSYSKFDYSVPAEHTIFLTDEDFAQLMDLKAVDMPYLRVRIHSKWNSARHIVKRIDSRARSVTFEGVRWPPWNRYLAAECPLRFENLRSAFLRPGEWFCDMVRGEIAYRPRPGEDIAAVRAIVPRDGVETLFRFRGDVCGCRWAGNVRFENVGFEYAAPRAVRGPADVPDSLMLAGFAEAMFMADGVRGLTFDGCRWDHTGSYGVWFRDGCMSNAVVDSVFTDLGGGAIRIGRNGGNGAVRGLRAAAPTGAVAYAVYVPHSTAFIDVENNLVEHGGRFLPGAGAIVLGAASDCRIVHNRIDDLHYSAIVCGWHFGYTGSPSQRNLVAFNHISNVGYGDLSDMAGVYMAGSGFGNLITDNVIHGVKGMVYGGWGLYPDEGTEGVVYRNNLVYDTKDGAVHQHFGRNNVFENNIFAFSHEGQVAITRPEPWRSYAMAGNIIVWDEGNAFEKYHGLVSGKAKVDWRRNLWWRLDGNDRVFNGKTFAEWQAQGNDRDGAFADPQFMDAKGRDFRLRSDSPALKLGFKPFDFTRAGRVPGRKVSAINKDKENEK